MNVFDLVSIIASILTIAGFFGLKWPQASKYKKFLAPISWLLLGFVISRVLYPILPSVGSPGADRSDIIFAVVLLGFVAIFVMQLQESLRGHPVYSILMLLAFVSGYGLLDRPSHLVVDPSEYLLIVEANERSGDLRRAIEMLTIARKESGCGEVQVLDERIGVLKEELDQRLREGSAR